MSYEQQSQVYAFPRVRLGYEAALFAGLTLFLAWAALNPQNEGSAFGRVGVVILSLPPWYYLYEVLRSPSKLVVKGRTLDAIYWSGRTVAFDRSELTVAPATFLSRAFWFSQVLTTHGQPAFRIWKEASGYSRVLSLLQADNAD